MTRYQLSLTWLAIVVLGGLSSPSHAAKELLYDFETDDQHREFGAISNPTTPPGWGSFGTITTDRGSTTDASAGERARFHAGDFDLPEDLPGNYGLVDVSDRFVPYRKDFSNYVGLSLDLKFKSNDALPFEGATAVEVGLGFMVPGVGEDESLQVYSDPITITDVYETYEVLFSDLEFIQAGSVLENDLANNAFIKIRLSNTADNWGRGAFYYDEVYGILDSGPSGSDADFDSDGDVDGADFLTWQLGYGQTGQTSNSAGDSNGDGVVDGLDLGVWESQFGAAPSTTQAIPEPGAGLIAGLLSLLAVSGGNRLSR